MLSGRVSNRFPSLGFTAGIVAALGGLWVLVALVLHFVLYFQVPLGAALSFVLGD